MEFNKNYDLSLPEWGPYSPRYAGGGLVVDKEKGYLMEFPVAVGYINYPPSCIKVYPPTPSINITAWAANEEMDYWVWRFTMDDINRKLCLAKYALIEFVPVDKHSMVVCASFYKEISGGVGRFTFDLLCGQFPLKPKIAINKGKDDLWVKASEYCEIYSQYRNYLDGRKPMVFTYEPSTYLRYEGATNGEALYLNYKDKGVVYYFRLPHTLGDAYLVFRYATFWADETQHFDIELDNQKITVPLPVKGTFSPGSSFDDWLTATHYLGKLTEGRHRLKITVNTTLPKRPAHILLDGFAITRSLPPKDFFSLIKEPEGTLKVIKDVQANSMSLINKRLETDQIFTLLGKGGMISLRDIKGDDITEALTKMGPYWYVHGTYPGQGIGRWLDLNISDISVIPFEKKTVYAVVIRGNDHAGNVRTAKKILSHAEEIVKKRRDHYQDTKYKVTNKHYQTAMEHNVSVSLMAATFPNIRKGKYVKFYAPLSVDRNFCFWDVGALALGLTEYSPKLALEAAATYFTDENEESLAIEHGSYTPTPVYAVWEAYIKTGDIEILKFFYPRIKRLYGLLSGNHPNSFFDPHKLNLVNAYHYEYESASCDDYPVSGACTPPLNHDFEFHPWRRNLYLPKNPVKFTRGIQWPSDDVGCAGLTSHVIRLAKILRLFAFFLGYKEDQTFFDSQIKRFFITMNKYMWDDKTGYFGWTKGKNYQMIRDKNGFNFNMGIDGVMPLITKECTLDQVRKMLYNLKSPRHLWTRWGVTNVDKSAPYYIDDGYWNGSVWMPHQWFLWKAILDYDPAFAKKIARTAVELWFREHERFLSPFEYFKHGEGCIGDFSSICNAYVLKFFAAYYQHGNVVAGYDTVIHKVRYHPNKDALSITISAPFGPERGGLVAVLSPSKEYRIGSKIVRSDETGAISLMIKTPPTPETIEIISAR